MTDEFRDTLVEILRGMVVQIVTEDRIRQIIREEIEAGGAALALATLARVESYRRAGR